VVLEAESKGAGELEIIRNSLWKQMHEIEHRYLLSGLPDNLYKLADSIVDTTHVYIPGNPLQERFSRIDRIADRSGTLPNTMYHRTVKWGHGLDRLEFEESISVELYNDIRWSNLKCTRMLSKRRFQWKVDELVFEMDQFLDRDLFLAEVEVPSIDSYVQLPEWLESCVIREVTEEVDFEGVNLAK
jgi:CYTH domain-containing protein